MASVISIIFDVSEKIEDFIDNHATFKVIAWYYLNFIPNIINLISPLIIFISALYFTARMASNTEIIPILSGGISYYRMLRPYFVVAVMLAFTDGVLKNYVVPNTNQAVRDFEDSYITQGYSYTPINIHRQAGKDEYFYARHFNYDRNEAEKFAIDRFSKGKLIYKLRGSRAIYDSIKDSWRVFDYTIRRISAEKESIVQGDSMRIRLPITKRDFGQKVRNLPCLTTPELNEFIESEKFKGEDLLSFYYVEKYKRVAMPFAIIILVMIAVAISSRKIRGGFGMHLLIGILTAITYELCMRFSTTLATNASFSPLLAVWLPNIAYSLLALFLIKRAQK